MTGLRRWHLRTFGPAIGILLASAAQPGCTRPRDDGADHSVPPLKATPPPTGAHANGQQRAKETDTVFGHAEEDAERLAARYCHNGGDLFGPPSGKPYPKFDDWDYQPGDPLSSCGEVHPAVLQTWRTKTASATLMRIKVIVEDGEGNGVGLLGYQEWVTIRTPDSVSDYLLTNAEENQSEEAPEDEVRVDLNTVELKDVVGGGAPDFIAIRTRSIGDCYECDFCYSQSVEETYLAICGDHPTKPGCIDVPLTSAQTWSPRHNPSDDCDETLDPDQADEIRGFAVDHRIPKKGVLVTTTRVPGSEHERVTGSEPPILGRFELEELFGTAFPHFTSGV